jgi:hypothetical protein
MILQFQNARTDVDAFAAQTRSPGTNDVNFLAD